MPKGATPEDQFDTGFWKAHGIPDPESRATMSVLELAQLLSKHRDPNSVQHIVLSHELNMKIVHAQNKASMNVAWLRIKSNYVYGTIYIFVPMILAFFIGKIT